MNKSGSAQCARAVSLFRGLYARVAHDLRVDVSYISCIARGERKSKVAEKALAKEFKKVVGVMRTDLACSSKKLYVVVKLECPRCKTQQKVHIAAGLGLRQTGGERISCINCDHYFKVPIPDKIIRGPFPA
jgi:transcription elongation factor Elf1